MLILPFPLGCFKYTSLQYGHLNTTSQSWKEEEIWSLLITTAYELEVHLKWVTSSTLLKRFGSGKLV